MYVPMVVGIKDGKVVGSHTALVDSFEIKDETSQMNDKQKKELQDIYTDIILKVAHEQKNNNYFHVRISFMWVYFKCIRER